MILANMYIYININLNIIFYLINKCYYQIII